MAFMMKKKRYKFQVEFRLEDLAAVPFVNAVLFAKVRLLDGGSFCDLSTREEVKDHTVRWAALFNFDCKMSANASTGVLDPCICRVSVRKEVKGGRSFQKLGFADLNLAEFAGSGQTTRRCLLEGYDSSGHRQDNSMLRVAIRMTLKSGDILFKAPTPSGKQNQMVLLGESQEDLAVPLTTSGVSTSTTSLPVSTDRTSDPTASVGFAGSLTKKRPQLLASELVTSSNDPTILEPADPPSYVDDPSVVIHQHSDLLGHSRNSSGTSQVSRGSGYGSLNSQSQHSRQSSSGESGHFRNPSSGSGFSDSAMGSLDRATKERRKKGGSETEGKESRMDATRVDPDHLIDELLRATNLDQEQDDAAETSGLQLFIAKDGTTALGGSELMSAGVFKQVVIDKR